MFTYVYQDILDWSSTDIISIALVNKLYLFKNKQKENSVVKLSELIEKCYSSIKFNPEGNLIAGGDETGNLFIYDIEKECEVQRTRAHEDRICTISWMNNHVLSNGSRDSTISNIDIRDKSTISIFKKHTQEVCGLKWSPESIYLASGGNENNIYVWDLRK